MSSGAVPVLALLDRLRDDGWRSRALCTRHEPCGPLEFDGRKPLSSRAYFQCLLARAEIFREGGLPFPSGLSQAFYKLLLAAPEKARVELTAAQCAELLAKA